MTTLTHILSRTSYRGKYTPDPVPRQIFSTTPLEKRPPLWYKYMK